MTHMIELAGHSLVTPESIAGEVFENANADGQGFDARVAAAKDRLLPRLAGAAGAFRNGAPTHEIGRDVTLWLLSHKSSGGSSWFS